MKRIHVNLSVRSLDESISFYTQLFDRAPDITKSDYAKWSLDDPSVNFSIVEHADPSRTFGVAHLGIEAQTPDELTELRKRISSIHGTVHDEGETTCCYHQSDKTWVQDQQGVEWETFYTSGQAATLHSPANQPQASSGCCQPPS